MAKARPPKRVRTLRVPTGKDGRQTGSRTVPITHEQGGLALQRSLDGAGWCVVHVASGCLVTPAYRLKAEARVVQRALLALDRVDWTWGKTSLQRLPAAQKAQIVALVTGPGPGT
jgi:hypothetical protein